MHCSLLSVIQLLAFSSTQWPSYTPARASYRIKLRNMKGPSVQITTTTSTTAAEEASYLKRAEGPSDNDISRQAQQGLPLALPWGTKSVRLGTTFHSRLQSTENPWSDETPFVLSDLHVIPKELHFEYGTNSTFKKVSTSRQSETGDHLSLGFGIGAGLPFVASVSVKGTFDQHIQENKDVCQLGFPCP